MAFKTIKSAMTFAIVVATVLFGMTLVVNDSAFAASGSTVVVVRPAFDDRIVVTRPFFRPFFNPFFFDREDRFDEFEDEDFFFDREDFFEREERPFFRRFERDDDDRRPFFRRFERDDD